MKVCASAIFAFAQLAYGADLYKNPSGITPESGAAITGFASDPVYIHENRKADRDFVCIARIDGVPTVSYELPKGNRLLKPAGTEDPTYCQDKAGFKYLLTPGPHSISVGYWDLDSFRRGYALPATFEVTLSAGQSLQLRRKAIGWSTTRLWIEDASGAQVGDARDVQYEGRRNIAFGQFVTQGNYTSVIPSETPDPAYSGAPIARLSVDVVVDSRLKDTVDPIRGGFADRLKECGVAARLHTVVVDDSGAVVGESDTGGEPGDAALTIVERGFIYTDRHEISLFGEARDPKQSPTNTLFDARLTLAGAQAPAWRSGVTVFFPTLMMRGLADAFVGRLSEDGYLQGCADIPKWDH